MLSTALTRLSRALHYVAMFGALPIIAIIIAIDVSLRYGFNSPLLWSFEANGVLLLIAVFGTLPYVTQRDRHIRMEIFYRRLAGPGRAAADALAAVVGGTFAVFLCYEMARSVPQMIAYNESGEFFAVPYWPFAAAMSAVGAIMTLQFTVQLVRALSGRPSLETGDPADPSEGH